MLGGVFVGLALDHSVEGWCVCDAAGDEHLDGGELKMR